MDNEIIAFCKALSRRCVRKEYVESIPEKNESWKGLFGAWRDTDEDLAQFVWDTALWLGR